MQSNVLVEEIAPSKVLLTVTREKLDSHNAFLASLGSPYQHLAIAVRIQLELTQLTETSRNDAECEPTCSVLLSFVLALLMLCNLIKSSPLNNDNDVKHYSLFWIHHAGFQLA